MSFELGFRSRALKEWKKLSPDIRNQFSAKLAQRLSGPRVPASALSGLKDCYKIKLRNSGYRLVYQVLDQQLLVLVIAVGRRDSDRLYKDAAERIR